MRFYPTIIIINTIETCNKRMVYILYTLLCVHCMITKVHEVFQLMHAGAGDNRRQQQPVRPKTAPPKPVAVKSPQPSTSRTPFLSKSLWVTPLFVQCECCATLPNPSLIALVLLYIYRF